MKRLNLITMFSLLTSLGVWAQDDTFIRVIDSTMVFSEEDFYAVKDERHGTTYIINQGYPDDKSYQYIAYEDVEIAGFVWWLPTFDIQYNERIASVDDISCTLEDEVLFLEDPQLAKKGGKLLTEDAPKQPFYVYSILPSNTTPNQSNAALLSRIAEEPYEQGQLYRVHRLLFKICPFRFDSQENKLYLYKKAHIQIRLKERNKNRFVQEGNILDQDGEPVPNALLTFADTCHVHTDANGYYQLVMDMWDSSFWGSFSVTADGYTTYVGSLSATFPLNDSGVHQTKNYSLYNAINFKEGQMSSVFLPETPDPSLGAYYRLDRVESNNIVFERDFNPEAYYPYILVPNKDACLELAGMDLQQDTIVAIQKDNIVFYGSFRSFSIPYVRSYIRYQIEPDDNFNSFPGNVEAMHATLAYPREKNYKLLLDENTAVRDIPSDPIVNGKAINSKFFDLSGRQLSTPPAKGIYIRDGKKVVR